MTPVFDGHNDVLLRLWKGGADGAREQFLNAAAGHISLAKANAGGLVGGLFAMFPPPGGVFRMPDFTPPYDVPLPPELPLEEAAGIIEGQLGVFEDLAGAGLLTHCLTGSDVRAALDGGRFAAVLHMEGAEAIGPELAELDVLYDRGLRSLGLVWSRPTVFGHGVPFRYPSNGDIGPGLTPAGKRLVARCAELGVMVDTSHLNVAGFSDVGEAGLPLVATHSNAHAISPGARNLTDDQLRAIGETGGMAGLNFGTMFLRPDGRAAPEGGLEAAIRHLDHMIGLAGDDHVGFGSDFDGAPMPQGLANASELPNLVRTMERAGFGAELIAKVTHRNWIDCLTRILG